MVWPTLKWKSQIQCLEVIVWWKLNEIWGWENCMSQIYDLVITEWDWTLLKNTLYINCNRVISKNKRSPVRRVIRILSIKCEKIFEKEILLSVVECDDYGRWQKTIIFQNKKKKWSYLTFAFFTLFFDKFTSIFTFYYLFFRSTHFYFYRRHRRSQ